MDIEKWGESPFNEPVALLRAADPAAVARLADVAWCPEGEGRGRFVVPVLQGTANVKYPELVVEAADGLGSFTLKLLTLLYLSKSDGTRPAGEWVAYRVLPNARFYEPVVKRSVEEPLAEAFANDPEGFAAACLSLGGEPAPFGDRAFAFSLFPLVRLCYILWLPDEEFPVRAQVLFDSHAAHHLNAFDLRMGAQDISGRLIRSGRTG